MTVDARLGELSRERGELMRFIRETDTAGPSSISRMLARMGGPICQKCPNEVAESFVLQLCVGMQAIPDDEDEENLAIAKAAKASSGAQKLSLRPKRDSVHGYVLKRPSHLYLVAICGECGNRFGSMDGRLFKQAFGLGRKRTKEETEPNMKRSMILKP